MRQSTGELVFEAAQHKNEEIRELSEVDFDLVLDVALSAWHHDKNAVIKDAQRELCPPEARIRYFSQKLYGMSIDGAIRGIVGFVRSSAETAFAELIWMGIHTDFQRMGYGNQLLQHAERCIRAEGYRGIILSTRVPSFYESNGFSILMRYQAVSGEADTRDSFWMSKIFRKDEV